MAILLVNPGGNTPQGFDEAEGDTFTFAPAPEPGPRHHDGVVVLFSSLPAIPDAHPAADVIQDNFIGTDTPGGRDMPGLGAEVVEFVHQFLGGPDTAPAIGAAVSEFVQSNPNETPGVVNEFVHGLLGGPDTTPGMVSDFVHDLMEARTADLTGMPHSDWLLS